MDSKIAFQNVMNVISQLQAEGLFKTPEPYTVNRIRLMIDQIGLNQSIKEKRRDYQNLIDCIIIPNLINIHDTFTSELEIVKQRLNTIKIY